MLVIGSNVAQAAQFAFSGAADCAIVSHSLSQSTALASQGQARAVSIDLYQPIVHGMVALSRSAEVSELYEFLQSDVARAVFRSSGFLEP